MSRARTALLSVLAAFVGVSLVPQASADPIRLNTGFATSELARNDDGSTAAVPLGFALNFFGSAHETVFVNNNGNISFVTGLGTFTPFGLTTNTSIEIIAPFFADVDTRNAGSAMVTFGEDTIDGRAAFGVNYRDVGYYSQQADKLNDFQVVLIDRADVGAGDFDIEFNYESIHWETGAASGGIGGLGGSSARAGYSRGTGVQGTFFELAGSGINGAFLDGGPNALVSGMFNSSEPGRYLFEVRNGEVTIPGLTPDNPLLPNSVLPGIPPVFFFGNVPGARWFDPPFVNGFSYEGLSGTLFSSVQFAQGFGDNFTLAAPGCAFADPFSSATLIEFANFCGGAGIGAFAVTGLMPAADAGDSTAFPTFLTFTTPTGSFSMQGIDSVSEVPEPGTVWMLLGGILATGYCIRAKRTAVR